MLTLAKYLVKNGVAFSSALVLAGLTTSQAMASGSLSIANSPLGLASSTPPNILLILDSSNTMMEGLDGGMAASCDPSPTASCPVGVLSPLSKSEMTREVGRSLVNKYQDQVNFGLMAYQPHDQVHTDFYDADGNPMATTQHFAHLGQAMDVLFDVSYDPANYDPTFSGVPWDSPSKRFKVPNPADPGRFIYYNEALPGIIGAGPSFSNLNQYRFLVAMLDSQDWSAGWTPGNNWMDEPFELIFFSSKVGTSDNIETIGTDAIAGYSGLLPLTTPHYLTDNLRARGMTHLGRQSARLPYGHSRGWTSATSPGLGYLHTPIAPLDEDHKVRLLKKLAPQHTNFSPTLLTDPEEPIISAGLTPLEGTLLTARDYFLNQNTYFGTDQGRSNALYPLPDACVNAAIWLTDGMPTVNKDGVALGADVNLALQEAVAAAETFHTDTNVSLYTVGFSMPVGAPDGALDQIAAAGGTGAAYLANAPAELEQALEAIFANLVAGSGQAATAAAVSSASLQSDMLVYLSAYRSADWSGELKAYEVNSNGTLGSVAWDAEATLRGVSPGSRRIFTYKRDSINASGSPVPLHFSFVSSAQKNALQRGLGGAVDGRGNARVQWLRGVEHADLRSRVDPDDGPRLLGDIVHSTPQFAGKRNMGYGAIAGSEGAAYTAFRASSSYKNRPDMLYVGTNAGMLHGFNARTGEERFAYMPSELLFPKSGETFARINRLMDPNYAHRYFVDGVPAIGDAYLSGSWRTVLVGSMGAGGRSVFALDVSNPSGFSGGNVLWEFRDPDLGYNVGQPQIVRMRNGDWAAVFGNGYNSDNDRAVLFVVRLSDGALLAKIDTGSGNASEPNGLASPSISDWTAMDLSARLIYAGALNGQLWRFDVSSANPADWTASSNRSVLFQAKDADGQPQPITSRPVVARHPEDSSKLIVLFGTGSFFQAADADLSNPQVQSLYGIFDTASGAVVASRSDLLQQSIVLEETFTPSGATTPYTGRQLSENTLDASHKGWYLDLVYNGQKEGERVIATPRLVGLQDERVRFSTMTLSPGATGCEPMSRVGRIADLQLVSGARNADAVFDLNQDGVIDGADDFKPARDMISHGAGFLSQTIRVSAGVELHLNNNPDEVPLAACR